MVFTHVCTEMRGNQPKQKTKQIARKVCKHTENSDVHDQLTQRLIKHVAACQRRY